jgi:hypothetical protein
LTALELSLQEHSEAYATLPTFTSWTSWTCPYHGVRIDDSLGSRSFFLLFLCTAYVKFQGLILEHTGFKGQFQRTGMFFSESKSPQIDRAALLQHIN